MIKSINSLGSKVYGALTESKPHKKLCNYFVQNPAKAIANSTIASIVAKDGIGCAFYVYQSYNNEKIPEKRRKFVTALDATNGILMIGTQIAMALLMRKINQKAFQGLFGKVFDKGGKNLKMYIEQIRADQKAEKLSPVRKFLLEQGYEGIKKQAFDTFSFFTELAAATIFAKRILVPFMATPLANKLEKWMNKHSSKSDDAKVETDNDSNPSMKGADWNDAIPAAEADGTTNLLDIYRKNHIES